MFLTGCALTSVHLSQQLRTKLRYMICWLLWKLPFDSTTVTPNCISLLECFHNKDDLVLHWLPRVSFPPLYSASKIWTIEALFILLLPHHFPSNMNDSWSSCLYSVSLSFSPEDYTESFKMLLSKSKSDTAQATT